MSPTTINASTHYIATPVDTMDRSEFGVQKNRKAASTGGGRAWSEDEEVYLLQTRLQKMPYKHIASHLKKTELACRLHYHQLSHGSNRRKRTSSITSSDAPSQHSMSPLITRDSSATPPSTSHGYAHPFSPEQATIHLPPTTTTLLPRSASNSPQRSLPAILPKPSPARAIAPTGTAPLRLDCALPPMTQTRAPSPPQANIDLPRLSALYDAHRSRFWSAIAAEYGPSASAYQLEDAYFRYVNNSSSGSASSTSTFAPPTPCISPDGSRESTNYVRMEKEKEVGKTSLSAILGIDASPRSPRERELIRQMEEGRQSA